MKSRVSTIYRVQVCSMVLVVSEIYVVEQKHGLMQGC